MLDTELIPARDRASKRLMVVLHGLGDSMEGYRWMPPMMKLPWLNYLLVNAPDDYYGGYSWYDIVSDQGPGIRRSRQLLFELLDAQRQDGFPTDQTVVFGFSQGSLLTMEVGMRYPHRLAGLVGISGYIFEPGKVVAEFSPVAKEQRFLVTHGTLDPLIPFGVTREQIASLRAAGLQIQWHEFEKEHTIAGEEELDLIREFVCGCFPD